MPAPMTQLLLAAVFFSIGANAAPDTSPENINTLAFDKNFLPKPHLTEHSGWVDLYYRAFEIAFTKVQEGTKENGFVDKYMDEAFNTNIFQWDTSFITMFGRYSNGLLPSIVSLDNFYRHQDADGWIGRELREKDGSSYWPKSGSKEANCSINPPLFSWAEWQSYQVTGDKSRFTKTVNGKPIIQILVSYFDWIKANRRWENGLYWTTSYANGMDRSPRLGTTDVCEHAHGSWIDISAQQALNALYIAKIANEIGDKTLSKRFQNEYRQLKQLVNKNLWDEQDKFYYDKDAQGHFYKVKTPASFWVWIAELTDKKKNESLIQMHLKNPTRFWTQHHLPTVAADEATYQKDGGYWDGAVWAPTTYQTLKGLDAQGYPVLAHRIAANHLEHLYWVYRKTNSLYENYKPEEPAKGVHARPDFVGWTGTGPIAALIENILGISVNAAEDTITWHLHLAEEHGIRQLTFGDNTVSLIAEDRLTSDAGAWISVKSTSKFMLNIHWGNRQKTLHINPGESRFSIGKPERSFNYFSLVHNGQQPILFGEEPVYQTFIAEDKHLRVTDVKIANLAGAQQGRLKAAIYPLDTTRNHNKRWDKPLAEQSIGVSDLPTFFNLVNLQWNVKNLVIGSKYALVLSADQTELDTPFAWLAGEELNNQVDSGKMLTMNSAPFQWQRNIAQGDAWLKAYFTR